MTSLTGVNVIQYYQTILFKSLGISSHMILALASVYGTLAFLSNVLTTRFLTDQWGRRKMILTGLTGIVIVEIYTAVMQHEFQDTGNKVGKGFTILGIYLFVVIYCTYLRGGPINARVEANAGKDGMLNSTTWLYGAEVLPVALRSKVMGLAAASHFIVNVGSESTTSFCRWKLLTKHLVTEAGPSAFANIREVC
jgi:MFS family permease